MFYFFPLNTSLLKQTSSHIKQQQKVSDKGFE